MREIAIIILLLMALGLKAPAISVVATDTIGGILYYNSPYEHNLTVDITENNPNYPGYGKGLSANTVYRFDDMLTITNSNNFPVCVVLHSQSDLVKFYTDGESLQAIRFTLRVNESMSVGLELSTAEIGLMEENYSVHITEGECSEIL